jgi:hypothetical protein
VVREANCQPIWTPFMGVKGNHWSVIARASARFVIVFFSRNQSIERQAAVNTLLLRPLIVGLYGYNHELRFKTNASLPCAEASNGQLRKVHGITRIVIVIAIVLIWFFTII